MVWSFGRAKGTSLITTLFGVNEISVDDVMKRLADGEKLHLLDTRDEGSWEKGHVRGAEHMPDSTIRLYIRKRIPDLDAEIVVYCAIGFYSLFTVDKLQKMGYSRVYSMSGGYSAWKDSDYPTIIEYDD
jgi:rhodanese-related sulfurtransferase